MDVSLRWKKSNIGIWQKIWQFLCFPNLLKYLDHDSHFWYIDNFQKMCYKNLWKLLVMENSIINQIVKIGREDDDMMIVLDSSFR